MSIGFLVLFKKYYKEILDKDIKTIEKYGSKSPNFKVLVMYDRNTY